MAHTTRAMKIAVLGATGATGSIFVKMALDAGHEVIALVRTPSKHKIIGDAKLTIVTGDATDAKAVAAAVKDVDAVVRSTGAGHH